jgi:glucosamine kinase
VSLPAWLAIDAGGTSTRSIVIRADGTCIGYGRAGGGNPISRGLPVAMSALVDSSTAALADAALSGASICGILVAMAGGDANLQDRSIAEALEVLGVDAPVRVESDALAAFESGASARSGYVLICGTGAAALRVDGGTVTATADGLGWLLGDAGSAFWIGRRVARAAVEELDHRGTSTALTRLVIQSLGIDQHPTDRSTDGQRPTSVSDMLVAVYTAPPVNLAGLAALAFEVPGDSVADEIIAEAAEALATTLNAVMAPHATGRVIATGGVLTGQVRLRDGVVQGMARRGLAIDLHAVPDGLAGSAMLALQAGGIVVDGAVRKRVRETLEAIRERTPYPTGSHK